MYLTRWSSALHVCWCKWNSFHDSYPSTLPLGMLYTVNNLCTFCVSYLLASNLILLIITIIVVLWLLALKCHPLPCSFGILSSSFPSVSQVCSHSISKWHIPWAFLGNVSICQILSSCCVHPHAHSPNLSNPFLYCLPGKLWQFKSVQCGPWYECHIDRLYPCL